MRYASSPSMPEMRTPVQPTCGSKNEQGMSNLTQAGMNPARGTRRPKSRTSLEREDFGMRLAT